MPLDPVFFTYCIKATKCVNNFINKQEGTSNETRRIDLGSEYRSDGYSIRFGRLLWRSALRRHAGSVREEQMDPHKNRTVSRLVFSGN